MPGIMWLGRPASDGHVQPCSGCLSDRLLSCEPAAGRPRPSLPQRGRFVMPLVARDDSLLVVIDLPPRLWGERLDADDKRCAEDAARRAAWLAAAAGFFLMRPRPP